MTSEGNEFRDNNLKVTLREAVTWGSTTYSEGKVIVPDREFLDFLIAGGLIEEIGNKEGEHEPDIRTRTIDKKQNE